MISGETDYAVDENRAPPMEFHRHSFKTNKAHRPFDPNPPAQRLASLIISGGWLQTEREVPALRDIEK